MIRDALAVCGLLGVIVASAVVANAWGVSGQVPSAEEETPEERIFATDPFGLEPGLAVVEMTHRGEGSFEVELISASQVEITGPVEFSGGKNGGSNTEVAVAIADETGPVDISKAVRIPVAGKHVLGVKADGPWTVRVEQPDPSVAAASTSFSGDDDTATPLFQLTNGPKKVTVTNPNGGDLGVSLLDGDGNKVASVPGTGPGSADGHPNETSSAIDVPEGIYLFDVRADGLWSIEISDAG